MRSRHIVAIVALSAFVSWGVAGCTTMTEKPTVVSVSLVTVQAGTSPLESDPAVKAARAGMLGETLSSNLADFTIAQLTSTHTPAEVEARYKAFVGDNIQAKGAPRVWVGPEIMLPLSVAPTADGAQVVGCTASTDWYRSVAHPTPSYHLASGSEYRYTLVRHGGRLDLDDVRGLGVFCDATGAPVARFTPAPTLPKQITADDIRAPLHQTS